MTKLDPWIDIAGNYEDWHTLILVVAMEENSKEGREKLEKLKKEILEAWKQYDN